MTVAVSFIALRRGHPTLSGFQVASNVFMYSFRWDSFRNDDKLAGKLGSNRKDERLGWGGGDRGGYRGGGGVNGRKIESTMNERSL